MSLSITIPLIVGITVYVAFIVTQTMRRVVDLHESKKIDIILEKIERIENKIK